MPKPKVRRVDAYMKLVTFTVLIAAFSQAMADAVAPGLDSINITCPASKLLPALDAAYRACNNNHDEVACGQFVDLYQQLLPRYDCHRSFDTDAKYPVPAIWLAGDETMEDYTDLLWRLAAKKRIFKSFTAAVAKARVLFASEQFGNILDGALDEEWGPKRAQLNPRRPGF